MESSLTIGDVRKMRIKEATDLQMRAKMQKENSTVSALRQNMPNWAKWENMVLMGILYSVVFLIVCCSYLCWCLLHSSVTAWWCKTLSCRANCLWTNMTFILLMLFPCVLVAYEMIHNTMQKVAKQTIL